MHIGPGGGCASELANADGLDQRIVAIRIEPACSEPERQRQPGGRCDNGELKLGKVNASTPNQRAEKTSQVVNAQPHDANRTPTVTRRFSVDIVQPERRKAMEEENTRRVEVIGKPSQFLFPSQQTLNERTIRTRPRHDRKVAHQAGTLDAPQRDEARHKVELLTRSLDRRGG